MTDPEPRLTGDPHPECWDLICVGTGLAEAMLAGAAAKAGKSVLHLDASDAYGGAWGVLADAAPHGSGWRLPRDPPASDDAEKVASDAPRENHGEETPPSTPTPTLPLPARGAPVASSTYRGFSALDLSADDDALLAALGGTRRPYALDLAAPKLVYCADGVVDALVASGAHNYCEFKALERTKVWWDGALRDVPASRAEVFRDRGLPPGDKRALMRLLKATWTAAVGGGVEVGTGDPDDVNVAMGAPGSEWGAGGGGGGADVGDGGGAEGGAASALYDGDGDGESFEACLAGARHRLSPKLTAFVAYALALCDARDATAREGFARLTRYLASLGRFGPAAGALLTPNYGVGEFSQAFCRVAAVAGATYVLRAPVKRVVMGVDRDDGETRVVTGVVTAGGQRLRCKAFVASEAAWPEAAADESNSRSKAWASRGVWIVDAPVVADAHQALIVFPPGTVDSAPAASAVRVLQLGSASGMCARGKYALFASTLSENTPSDDGDEGSAARDLRGALELLVDVAGETRDAGAEAAAAAAASTPRPRLVWGCHYRQALGFPGVDESALPANVALCPTPDASIDVDAAVNAAIEAHQRLWGDGVGEMFAGGGGGGGGGGDGGGGEGATGGGGEGDEDEFDALLRDIPGQPKTSDGS